MPSKTILYFLSLLVLLSSCGQDKFVGRVPFVDLLVKPQKYLGTTLYSHGYLYYRKNAFPPYVLPKDYDKPAPEYFAIYMNKEDYMRPATEAAIFLEVPSDRMIRPDCVSSYVAVRGRFHQKWHFRILDVEEVRALTMIPALSSPPDLTGTDLDPLNGKPVVGVRCLVPKPIGEKEE